MAYDILFESIAKKAWELGITKPSMPSCITNNLKLDMFEWNKNAILNFLTYQEIRAFENDTSPTHLMFNMATGSGKTLLMAATILYYYQKGYRYFIFFVNQNNIVDKTENNFINSTHNKYLFTENIVIDNKPVSIKKVDNFSDNPQSIEIKFTSIHKLYNDIHIERENQTTLDDLHKLTPGIVLLADEAHHLNTDTSSLSQTSFNVEEIKDSSSDILKERKGWEHTVKNLILNKKGSTEPNNNILLEFTATVPKNAAVQKKYEDKIIAKFDLKDFMREGFTKEINLLSSTFNKKERMLHALLFNWYRHNIAIKHSIPNFKGVMLFRSKTIVESSEDYNEFLALCENLTANDFDFLNDIESRITQSQSTYEQGKSRTRDVLQFIAVNNISYSVIAKYISQYFKVDRNVVITNSKTNKTKKEKTDSNVEQLLNSLEDKNNHIRAIFTVDRLTEGWDVLNLFDIIRLYQTQQYGGSTKKANKVPEATTKEIQLIGRGVRYFPFNYPDKISNARKFDEDLKHDLRVLEELYYYTYDEDSKYISHLKDELKKAGLIADSKVVHSFNVKQSFKDNDFYKDTQVWHNELIDNSNKKKSTLADFKTDGFDFTYHIKGVSLNEQEVDLEKDKNDEEDRFKLSSRKHRITIKFSNIDKHIILKAVNIKALSSNSLLRFSELKEVLKVSSVEDLLDSKYLGNFILEIVLDNSLSYDDLAARVKLNIVLAFLTKLFAALKADITPKIGGNFIATSFSTFFDEPKEKSIDPADLDKTDVPSNDWYILDSFVGTSEEVHLIDFIKTVIGNLEKNYKEVYLLRNEEIYKIYDFSTGQGFQPDFILFLKDDKLYYQIFIEPKGDRGLKPDKWKEDFLKEISIKYGATNLLKHETKKYSLIGLPFYNKKTESTFKSSIYNKLNIK
jgi:type III restriction enzyme